MEFLGEVPCEKVKRCFCSNSLSRYISLHQEFFSSQIDFQRYLSCGTCKNASFTSRQPSIWENAPSPSLASSSSLTLCKNIVGRSFSTWPEVAGEKIASLFPSAKAYSLATSLDLLCCSISTVIRLLSPVIQIACSQEADIFCARFWFL